MSSILYLVLHALKFRFDSIALERLVGSTQNTTMTLEVPCMVQEYIQGESLYDRLGRKKTALPEPEALKYIQQIGSALTVVHRQNMVHRDVKPENIMLRQSADEAVLIDFGLVRPINIKRHTAFRSDGYAPPEQYLDETDRDATLDVYALAATLYVLVIGLDPVGDTRLVESKLRGSEQHMGRPDPLKRPEYWNPGISSQVSNAIWQGLKLLPGERPPTIAAWLGLMGLSLENDGAGTTLTLPTTTLGFGLFVLQGLLNLFFSFPFTLLGWVEGGYYTSPLPFRSGRATFTASGSRCS